MECLLGLRKISIHHIRLVYTLALFGLFRLWLDFWILGSTGGRSDTRSDSDRVFRIFGYFGIGV